MRYPLFNDPTPLNKAYALLATTTVLSYDFLCTFDREVEYIWPNPSSPGAILFFLNRYLPFIDTGMALHLAISTTTPEMCRRYTLAMLPLLDLGVILSEVILMLRTYAIWNKRRWVLVVLALELLLLVGFYIYVMNCAVRVLRFGFLAPTRLPIGCCIVRSIYYITSRFYSLVLIPETTILVLTAIKGAKHLKQSRSRWVDQMYKDGFWFYVYMLLITMANVTVAFRTEPVDEKEMLSSLQRVLHSVFSSRVILNIQTQRDECRRRKPTSSQGTSLTDFFTTVMPDMEESSNFDLVSSDDGYLANGNGQLELERTVQGTSTA